MRMGARLTRRLSWKTNPDRPSWARLILTATACLCVAQVCQAASYIQTEVAVPGTGCG